MSSPTHHWIKRLADIRKPAYLAIPDLIEEDLATGRLRPRDRLPGLRDLAEELALNYTTVARAYAEARKRGLLDSRAGRGTFVRGRTATLPLAGGSSIEMSMNTPPEPPDYAARLRDSAARLMSGSDPYQLLRYQDFGGSAADKDAGAEWLKHRVPHCDAQNVLVCPGIHSALVALVSQLARPGGTICLDALAYPGIKAIAAQLGVRLQSLPRDDEGPLAHAFEALCKTDKPSAFYCNPTLQNPSTLTLTPQTARGARRCRVALQRPDHRRRCVCDAAAECARCAREFRARTDLLRDGFIEESRRWLAGRASARADCAANAAPRRRVARDNGDGESVHGHARNTVDRRRHCARHAQRDPY